MNKQTGFSPNPFEDNKPDMNKGNSLQAFFLNERTKDFIIKRIEQIEKIDTWKKRLESKDDDYHVTNATIKCVLIEEIYDLRMAINNLIADIKKGVD